MIYSVAHLYGMTDLVTASLDYIDTYAGDIVNTPVSFANAHQL